MPLSYGKAEMVGVTKAAVAAQGFLSPMVDFGVSWLVRVHADSAASIGMCSRQGICKVIRTDTQVMWIQRRIRANNLDLYKVAGEKNPADILSKADIPIFIG